MLKLRVLTAALLIPVVLYGVIYSTVEQFFMFTGLLYFFCAVEWVTFFPQSSAKSRAMYLIFMAAVFVSLTLPLVLHSVELETMVAALWIPIIFLSLLWWCGAIFLILYYPRNQRLLSKTWISAFISLFTLIPSWFALTFLKLNYPGGELVNLPLLLLFFVIWGADTGAYFAGGLYGKHKLIPRISPGKSWEGLAGALVITVIIAVIGSILLSVSVVKLMAVLIVVAFFSIVGDLQESMMKRAVGVKDSGRLLPGHGGLLDRLDSLFSAAPVFTVLWLLFIH